VEVFRCHRCVRLWSAVPQGNNVGFFFKKSVAIYKLICLTK
jgi:hypothetical protein